VSDWRYRLAEQRGTLLALGIFILMFAIYLFNHPAIAGNGFTARAVGNVVQTAANKGVLLALVAMAQALVVITAGIDLSVGMICILANCVASYIVVGSFGMALFGCAGVLVVGLICGAINGIIVIYGRLQPIVTTIATGSIFYGIALYLRPQPEGAENFNSDLADLITGRLPGGIPASLVALFVVALVIWVPFRKSALGRAAYATGSSEVAAYMSGVPIARAKFAAYTLSGLLASIGGLYLTFVTYSGEASLANGGTYTLSSIAAVVIGGVSLFGGSGSAIGAIFGALAYSTVSLLLFVFNIEALWQPLFEGVVLLLAVSIGSARLLQIRNRLDLFG
jgi:ribose transport system permease protein